MKPTHTSWGGVAEWYDELMEQSPDSFQKNVLMPNLIRIIEPKKGMAILDVACGQGYFSRAFASNGAKVIGSDISAELIQKAKNYEIQKKIDARKGVGMKDASKSDAQVTASKSTAKNPIISLNQNPEYAVAPADKLGFVKDASVDVVTIILAIQNIENIGGTFSEAARVIKSGGKMILVLNHP